MKILIVGAGMYVTGRNGTGVGTVLAALAQASKNKTIDEVLVVAYNPDNHQVVVDAVFEINSRIDSQLAVRYQALTIGRCLKDQITLADFGCAIVAVPDHAHFAIASELIENGVAT